MILNLTQHPATPDQIAAGVVDLPTAERAALVDALTFDECPSAEDVAQRAHTIAEMAAYSDVFGEQGAPMPGRDRAMIGGAPWLMAPLAEQLRQRGIEPVFAFSRREVAEQAQPDGSVRKVAVFRHAGWVPAA